MFWLILIVIGIIVGVVIYNGNGYWAARTRNNIVSWATDEQGRCCECKHCCLDEEGRYSDTGYFCSLSKCDYVTENTVMNCFEKPKINEQDIEEIISMDILTDGGIQYIRQNLLGKAMTLSDVKEYFENLSINHPEFMKANNHQSDYNPQVPEKVAQSRTFEKHKRTWYYLFNKNEIEKIDNFDFKVDCLLESLNADPEPVIEEYYIMRSLEEGLPYFCDNEDEYDALTHPDYEKNALCGLINGIQEMLFLYAYSKPNKCKLAYWKNRIVSLASNGSREAQAALCSRRVFTQAAFSEEEIASFSRMYLNRLYMDAGNGDIYAKYAIGKHISDYMSDESFRYLRDAAQAGLSDAWYELGLFYDMYPRYDRDNKQIKPCTPEQSKAATITKFKCFLNGANANNGQLAAICQYWVGDCYLCGDVDLGFQFDLQKARYYLALAKQNCNPMNARLMYSIDRDLEKSNAASA